MSFLWVKLIWYTGTKLQQICCFVLIVIVVKLQTKSLLPKRSTKEALGPHCRLFWYLGPHWTQKGVIFPPNDEVYRHMIENHLMLPYYIRRQYLFVDFCWSQYSLYYVTVGDPFSQFQFFQSLFTDSGDLSLKYSAFHIGLVGKRSAFGQKNGGHLVGICSILVKKSFGNTAHWLTHLILRDLKELSL